jgi:hypothetical protein
MASGKVGKPPGTVFRPTLYISRRPGELSGRTGWPTIWAGDLLEGGFYIQNGDSYIEMTSAGHSRRLPYI